LEKIRLVYIPEDKGDMLDVFVAMSGKIGTKRPCGFMGTVEKYRNITAEFWNQVVAAYCFCRADQRNEVFDVIAQTLNRLETLILNEVG
jgi:hypothetical protein